MGGICGTTRMVVRKMIIIVCRNKAMADFFQGQTKFVQPISACQLITQSETAPRFDTIWIIFQPTLLRHL